MTKIEVSTFGFKQVSTKFNRMAHEAVDARPAFNEVTTYLMNVIDKTFSSEGRRGGGSWKRLSTRWLRFKVSRGFDTRILHQHRPSVLRRSVTKRRARGQVLLITPHSMTLASNLDYAATQQFGRPSRGIPARPFIKTTPTDREQMRNIVRDHLMRPWQKGGGASARSQRR